MMDNGDGKTTQPRHIDWTMVMVQGLIQLILFGSMVIGYALSNERWKGGIDASIQNFILINATQVETNTRLQLAIEKLSDSINILSSNQQRVIALLEIHMNADASKFKAMGIK